MALFPPVACSFMGENTQKVHTADRKAKRRVNFTKPVKDVSKLFFTQDHKILNYILLTENDIYC